MKIFINLFWNISGNIKKKNTNIKSQILNPKSLIKIK